MEDLSAEFLDLRDARQLVNLDDHKMSRLRHFLRGMKVILSHRPTARPKRIKGLVKDAGAITFDKDGRRITVAVWRSFDFLPFADNLPRNISDQLIASQYDQEPWVFNLGNKPLYRLSVAEPRNSYMMSVNYLTY